MHVGHSYETMYDRKLWNSQNFATNGEEKDLGVYITSDLKPSTQCNKAANKAVSLADGK